MMHVKFIGIPVKDPERALQFYTEKLGFTVHTDAPMGQGERWIELQIPGAETGVVLFTPKGQEDRIGTFQNMGFATDDIESLYKILKDKGVEFTVPPKKEPWGTQCQFKDSEGNTLLISSVED